MYINSVVCATVMSYKIFDDELVTCMSCVYIDEIAAGALAISEPADACVSLEAPLSGAIMLVLRGGCSFVEKAINVQAAGAIGMVVINHVAAQSAFTMGFDQQDVTVDLIAMMVSKEVGLELLDTAGQLEVHRQQTYINIEAQAHSNLSANTGQTTREHHVIVPDATQRWLQSHRHLQKDATAAWQSLLMDLAAPVLSLKDKQTLHATSILMQSTPEQCVAPD